MEELSNRQLKVKNDKKFEWRTQTSPKTPSSSPSPLLLPIFNILYCVVHFYNQ